VDLLTRGKHPEELVSPGRRREPEHLRSCGKSAQTQMNHAQDATADRVWSSGRRSRDRPRSHVTLFDGKLVDSVSKRVGGYQYNPHTGFLFALAWVR
jgi:hypothetical protein